jgi:transposase
MWMGVFMLVGEMALEIRLLAKRGKGLRAIAREIGVSRNTVRRYLRDGDADRYRQRPRRSGKLAAFDDYIAKRLAEAAGGHQISVIAPVEKCLARPIALLASQLRE